MLKYKIFIKLFVLNCVFVCCVYGDAVQTDVVMLCLLVWIYCHLKLITCRQNIIRELYWQAICLETAIHHFQDRTHLKTNISSPFIQLLRSTAFPLNRTFSVT
jgi:hypothetical protein